MAANEEREPRDAPASPGLSSLPSTTPLDRGAIVNLIGSLRRRQAEHGVRITDVQNRRIMQRIEDEDLHRPGREDLTRETQLYEIARVVGEVVGMEAVEVEAGLGDL